MFHFQILTNCRIITGEDYATNLKVASSVSPSHEPLWHENVLDRWTQISSLTLDNVSRGIMMRRDCVHSKFQPTFACDPWLISSMSTEMSRTKFSLLTDSTRRGDNAQRNILLLFCASTRLSSHKAKVGGQVSYFFKFPVFSSSLSVSRFSTWNSDFLTVFSVELFALRSLFYVCHFFFTVTMNFAEIRQRGITLRCYSCW